MLVGVGGLGLVVAFMFSHPWDVIIRYSSTVLRLYWSAGLDLVGRNPLGGQ